MPSNVAAGITLAKIVIIILLPLTLVIKEIVSQIYGAIQSGKVLWVIEKNRKAFGPIASYNLNLSDLTNNFLSIGVKTLSGITLSVTASLVSFL